MCHAVDVDRILSIDSKVSAISVVFTASDNSQYQRTDVTDNCHTCHTCYNCNNCNNLSKKKLQWKRTKTADLQTRFRMYLNMDTQSLCNATAM